MGLKDCSMWHLLSHVFLRLYVWNTEKLSLLLHSGLRNCFSLQEKNAFHLLTLFLNPGAKLTNSTQSEETESGLGHMLLCWKGNAPLLKLSCSLFSCAVSLWKLIGGLHSAFSFACTLPSCVLKSQCRHFRHPDDDWRSEKHWAITGNDGHKTHSSKALFFCAIFPCFLQHKKLYSFLMQTQRCLKVDYPNWCTEKP